MFVPRRFNIGFTKFNIESDNCMFVPRRFKIGFAKFNIEFGEYMIVCSRFKIEMRPGNHRLRRLFMHLRNLWMALLQNNFTLPVAVARDADDEVLSQRPSVAVAARDQTGVRHRFAEAGVF